MTLFNAETLIVMLAVLQAVRIQADSCYSCFYSLSSFLPGSTSCIKPSSQTISILCTGGCYTDFSGDTVFRGCTSQCTTSNCKTCTGDKCNSEPAPISSCYSCSYLSPLLDTKNCIKVNTNTSTQTCWGGCASKIEKNSVFRGCSAACTSANCMACSDKTCNSEPALFSTCYSCTSLDANCNTGTNRTDSCNGKCMKKVETIETTMSPLDVISRSCSSSCTEETIRISGLTTSTYCCDKDLCNGSSVSSFPVGFGVMSLLRFLYAHLF